MNTQSTKKVATLLRSKLVDCFLVENFVSTLVPSISSANSRVATLKNRHIHPSPIHQPYGYGKNDIPVGDRTRDFQVVSRLP